jgi:hypothetical protein
MSQAAAQPLPFVSIIVLNYNGADLLRPFLNSMRDLAYPRYEVILVDNGSTDNSRQILAEFPWAKVFTIEHNVGTSRGYNIGLQYGQGEFILIMNNDMVANREFVSVLSDYLVKHPEVGIVQGKMVMPQFNRALEVCGSFLTRYGFLYHYGYCKPDGPKYQQSQPVFCAKGACMMFRREVIDKAGGYFFNEDFFCIYEESDLCHRAWLAGYETHFVPSPPVEHLGGTTIEREEKAGFGRHQYLRNMTYSLLTNLAPASLLRIMPLYLGIFVISMTSSVLTGKWIMAKAHWKALAYNLCNLKKIHAQRRRIRAIRKKSDREIFAKVLRNPGPGYLIKSFQGRLAEYVD